MRAVAVALTLAVGAVTLARAQLPAREPAGLTVVLLLDVSASVSRLPMPIDQRFAQVFNAFLQGLKASDRAAVGIVCAHTRFSRVTSDQRALALDVRALLQVPEADRLGPSPLWDALDDALTLATDPAGRPAIVLFSDGRSTGNLRGLSDVVAHAKTIHASIDAVVEGGALMPPLHPGESLDPADLLQSLTDATGGHRLLDRSRDLRQRNPGPLVAQIMAALHQR